MIEALLSTVRGLGKIALAVASSGIAAELLEGGRTAHSRFKIPIPINESSVCNISLQSDITKLIQKTSLIIWDEVMMSHVHQVDCVDHSLHDIMKIEKPFGGVTVVFGGRGIHVRSCLLFAMVIDVKLSKPAYILLLSGRKFNN